MGDDLDELLRRAGGSNARATAAVWAHWDDAVGSAVAAHARPLSVKGTTLLIAVDSPAYATQLRLLGPQLIQRLAQFGGAEAVSAIEVTVRA